MKIGIFFGGGSREREISFAGGRTVYDNLNKDIFEAIPIFVDSFGHFILLDWKYIYKGTIRDFFPPAELLPASSHNFQVYQESLGSLPDEKLDQLLNAVGKKITLEELPSMIDFGFLSLHGAWGEDGSVQGVLEWLGIPYSGSGILPSAIGMDKAFQKEVMRKSGFNVTRSMRLTRNDWLERNNSKEQFKEAIRRIGLPFVIRPANQGSSIGVSIVTKKKAEDFEHAVDSAFFTGKITFKEWNNLNPEAKVDWVRNVSEIKDGIGIPFLINGKRINHPEELLEYAEEHFLESQESILLQSVYEEQEVLIESFINGTEFSCIVIRNENGEAVALPPTEIKKGKEVFDYRSKYLAGMTRKVTPIDLDNASIEKIRKACEDLFKFFGFHVYARIDGFIRKDKKIFLNDPNTTSGMLPSSFFFHQAAEIGLNPSQFLTYIIRTSLEERIRSQSFTENYRHLLTVLDDSITKLKDQQAGKKKIAVILGGYSSERHISVESGRNVFEKLSSSSKYEAIPVFLIGNESEYSLYQIPVNLLLKDNADDIRDKILHFKKHPVIEKIKKKCRGIISRYASAGVIFEPRKISLEELQAEVDGVFIALHGRPGEDGHIQSSLDKLGVAYNGSGVSSSQITINKYQTNELLKQHGLKIANHRLLQKANWEKDRESFYEEILAEFPLPFICKPVDDGCSAAVKKIKSKEELNAYCHLIFRGKEELSKKFASVLQLKQGEEFPRKNQLLVEELIGRNGAKHFLEITGGMLSKMNGNGEWKFEVFEPSETLAGEDVLSLEEKFLAGEGQNITPARFSPNAKEYDRISETVKAELEKVAKVVGVSGYCRIDAFVRIYEGGKSETIIIEVNSLPGMTPATCIFHQAAINQYKPFDFIDKILEFSFEKRKLAAG